MSINSPNIVILGMGTVGKVLAAAFAKKRQERTYNIHLIGRSDRSTLEVAEKIQRLYGLSVKRHCCDIMQAESLIEVLNRIKPSIVVNVATPNTHINVMRACLEVGSHYIDTAVYETSNHFNMPPPWYSDELALREQFRQKGLTAILSIGLVPGVINVFCNKARKDYLDTIETIDILCANAGAHNQFFATNFNAAINLKELSEDTGFWKDSAWHSSPPFSRSIEYNFPIIGKHKLYSVGHEEVHSLSMNIPEAKIEFWMRIGDSFRSTFDVLQKIGLLSLDPIDLGKSSISPLDFLAKILPTPETFVTEYRGTACVGALISGTKSGKSETIFIHSLCSNEDCYDDLGTHVTAFTTAIPAMAAALLVLSGDWDVGTMVHPEELPPDPFLCEIRQLGLEWHVTSHSNLQEQILEPELMGL
ncbi:MAG: saccharopine dehydrogenase NADP-binding domain-containing protein [Pseudomonadaceae bacterium]|nr:saccharopine dehydrogenase NADP-binding domain-containing protein [Pseudomonadaceae bacterium]